MRGVAEKRAERIRRQRFLRLVRRALQRLPDDIHAMLDNVEVVVEDEPSPVQRHELDLRDADSLFGLYQGIPLTDRGSSYNMVLPDKITIFRGPLERACASAQEVEEEVRVTVIHELAHHVGIDEDRLDELGWS